MLSARCRQDQSHLGWGVLYPGVATFTTALALVPLPKCREQNETLRTRILLRAVEPGLLVALQTSFFCFTNLLFLLYQVLSASRCIIVTTVFQLLLYDLECVDDVLARLLL